MNAAAFAAQIHVANDLDSISSCVLQNELLWDARVRKSRLKIMFYLLMHLNTWGKAKNWIQIMNTLSFLVPISCVLSRLYAAAPSKLPPWTVELWQCHRTTSSNPVWRRGLWEKDCLCPNVPKREVTWCWSSWSNSQTSWGPALVKLWFRSCHLDRYDHWRRDFEPLSDSREIIAPESSETQQNFTILFITPLLISQSTFTKHCETFQK